MVSDEHKKVIIAVQEMVTYLDNLARNQGFTSKLSIGVFVPVKYKGVADHLPKMMYNTDKLQVMILYDQDFPQNEIWGIIRGYESSREIGIIDSVTEEWIGTGKYETYEEPFITIQYLQGSPYASNLSIRKPDFIKRVVLDVE